MLGCSIDDGLEAWLVLYLFDGVELFTKLELALETKKVEFVFTKAEKMNRNIIQIETKVRGENFFITF
jgi:hypothetical protein